MNNEEKKIIDEKMKNYQGELSDDMFIGFNEAGEEKTFYKLLEFDSAETGKHYLAYTDNEKDENGNLKAYGSIVIQDGEVKVNGEVCMQRGKKLRSGDKVDFNRVIYVVE